MTAEKKNSPREYPPAYEKIVPVALVLLAIVIAGILIAAAGVVLGWIG